MLVKRLQNQNITSPTRMVYEEQLRLGWPGLAEEVKKICSEVGLPDVNLIEVKKEKVKEMIYYHHYKDMKEQIQRSSKLDKIKHEDFRKEQSYMEDRSIDRCRTKFWIRTEMMKTFKDNFHLSIEKENAEMRRMIQVCSARTALSLGPQTHRPIA